MPEIVGENADGSPMYAPEAPTGPVYSGPTPGGAPGYHDVTMPDGETLSVHASNLPDHMAAQALQQYDALGNPYEPTNVKPVKSLKQALGLDKPQRILSQYDNQGNVVAEGTPEGEGAVGENSDGSLMTAPVSISAAPAAAAAPAATGPASVPIPAGVGFIGGGGSAAPTQAAAPTPSRAGGPRPAATPAGPSVFDQEGKAIIAANQAQADVATNLAQNQQAIEQRYADQQAAHIAQREATAAQAAQKADAALKRSQAILEQFVNQKVDPNSYWGNMSTGDHVLAGLSMLLSGIGAGITGKDNLAVAHFNKMQDQDIAAQRFNIEHGKEASELYSKRASDFLSAGLSRQHALDATDLSIKQQATTDLEIQAQALGGDAAVAKLKAANATVPAQMAMQTQQLAGEVQKNALAKAQTAQSYAAAQKDLAEANKAGKPNPALAVPMDDGTTIYATSPESAGKAQDANAKFGAVDSALNEYVRVLSDPNSSTAEKQSAGGTAKNLLGAALGVAREAGAPIANETALSEAIDPAGYVRQWLTPGIDARAIKRVQETQKVLRANKRGVIRAHVQPGQVPREVKSFKTVGGG